MSAEIGDSGQWCLAAADHRGPARSLPGIRLCRKHLDDIAGVLGQILEFHRLLRFESALPRGTEEGNAEVRRPKQPDQPAPTRLDVAAMFDPRTGPMIHPGDLPYVPRELEVWTTYVSEARRVVKPQRRIVLRRAYDLEAKVPGREWALAQARVEVMVAYLRRHAEWLANDAAAEMYRQHLRSVRAKLAIATGQTPPKPFAHCYAVTEDGECGGPIRMAPGERQATCPRCGRIYAGPDLVRLRVVAASEERAS